MADSPTTWPANRRNRSGILITGVDPPMRQNVLFCAFAMDRQLTVEAAPNGGYCPAADGPSPPQSVTCRADEF